ncbi:7TM diverse intracellular signaling domain-containing protein [Niabella insulamsoli]|uniref:7TM diverse intracellular signaling domain-containing protein n=1 Tax=Niabella insulamsoli TaxID=3144874 RepID=UPI0031FBADD4
MKNSNHIYIYFAIAISFLLGACSHKTYIEADYAFTAVKDVTKSIQKFNEVAFDNNANLDLGFYRGTVWIKLDIANGKNPSELVVLCNDLINHNYRFYQLDTSQKRLLPQRTVNFEKYDHRAFQFAKPNFKIRLEPFENASFLMTTFSDGRILQATPQLMSVEDFLALKERTALFDMGFYGAVVLLLCFNLFYFRMLRSDIYYYYAAYILSGCLMYLFVEGRLYGWGLSKAWVDHLMFISIRIWVLFSVLFTLNFLDIKITHPRYYRFTQTLLFATLGLSTLFQLVYFNTSIRHLHQFENLVGFVWIIVSLVTVMMAFKKRKLQSTYYLISYSILLFFVTLGLIDSHTTILPGDPFSYFKVGTILEFFSFTYFISRLIRKKLLKSEILETELSQNRTQLLEKENQISSKTDLISIFKLIENSYTDESDWKDFKEQFKALNPNFVSSLLAAHPDLTKSEIRLITLLKIGYSQKEVAEILHIAPESVKKARSRVRKKMHLDENQRLSVYLNKF